jgi:hypothetical protein
VTGIKQDMRFLLYVGGNASTPYRACNLWVDVDPIVNGTDFDRRT